MLSSMTSPEVEAEGRARRPQQHRPFLHPFPFTIISGAVEVLYISFGSDAPMTAIRSTAAKRTVVPPVDEAQPSYWTSAL